MKSPVAPLTIAFTLIIATSCGNSNFGSTNDKGSIVSLSANDLNQSGSGKVTTKSADATAAAADTETKKECDTAQGAQTADTAQSAGEEKESGCQDDHDKHDDHHSADKSDKDEECDD